jgi:hypothetical protein
MATRFSFTFRDWTWLCLVMALAIGWGSHFRYTRWLYANRPPGGIVSVDRMLESELKTARALQEQSDKEWEELRRALKKVMTPQQWVELGERLGTTE